MRIGCGLVAGLALSACLPSSPLPDMQPGETGRVVRIIDGDALALNTGQSVRLIGIEAPALRPRNREPDAYSVEASRALEDMALGREVQLFYSGMTRDRYDRALAHVVTVDGAGPKLWLNLELVRRGAARVRFYPDTVVRVEDFLGAENQARLDKVGLWAKAAYRVTEPQALPDDQRGFTIISAKLGESRQPDGPYAENQACHRSLEGSRLVIEVRREAREICTWPDGATLRIRGWVSDDRLDLTLIEHVEKLD